MSLKVKHIKNIMEEYAPLHLKEDYDNVGIMIGDLESEVTSILVALDCTLDVLDEAIEKNCNFILTHHPILFARPHSITPETLLGRKIIKIIKNDINVYSSHTNLDVVSEGINDILMDILDLKTIEILKPSYNHENPYMGCGIGRLSILDNPIKLGVFCDKIKKSLEVDNLRCNVSEDVMIDKIAVINGSGEDYFEIAKAKGANCILTGDTSYHQMSDYLEENIAIVDAGHFGTEWPAMKAFANKFEQEIKELGFQNNVFISEKSQDPYKYI